MGYICYLSEKEYVTNYDVINNKVSVSDKLWKAIIFDSERDASHIADIFGCYYKREDE